MPRGRAHPSSSMVARAGLSPCSRVYRNRFRDMQFFAAPARLYSMRICAKSRLATHVAFACLLTLMGVAQQTVAPEHSSTKAAAAAAPPAATTAAPLTPTDIVLRALQPARRNLDVKRNYVYQQREVEKELDKDGRVKKTEIKTYDVLWIVDRSYSKLVSKDDKTLTEKEQRKEEEDLQKFSEKRKKEVEKRARRKEKDGEDRDEESRKILNALPRAYVFAIVGEQSFDGCDAWIIEGTPNKQFKSSNMIEKFLTK